MRPDLPNLLSTARLLLIPVLWILFSARQFFAQGIVLFVAGLTDVLDGYLARRMRRASKFGSRMDTAADIALLVSVYAWIVMIAPELMWSRRWFVVAAITLTVVFLAIGWLRFRRIADLHLYTAKAAGVFTHAFIVIALLGRTLAPLFDLALAVATIAALESVVVVSTRGYIDERAGSIFKKERRTSRR